MVDIVDKATRSRMMAGIRDRNTKPECVLRLALHARGFRYRLHVKNVAGRPDLVVPKYRAAVFVHGCFWHRHEGCHFTTTPATRPEFWRSKFSTNVARDITVRKMLLESGWRVATVWECALRKPEQIEVTTERLSNWLRSEMLEFEIGQSDLEPDSSKSPI